MRMVLKIRKRKGELLMLVKIVVTIGIIAVFFYIRNSVKVEQGMEYERNCRKKEQVTALFSFFTFRKSHHML